VESHKCAEIELGGLEELDFANVDVLERVDALCGFLDLPTDNLGDELRSELGESAAASLALNDLCHLSPNGADLR